MYKIPPPLTKISRLEYKKHKQFDILYGLASTRFGNCLIALHEAALCHLQFYDYPDEADVRNLKRIWGKRAVYRRDDAAIGRYSLRAFAADAPGPPPIFLKGTEFQLVVWETLLGIGRGSTVSYESVAAAMGRPTAVRAVARAVATNNIMYFVPCHRVIRKNGHLHKYAGGIKRKAEMLRYEGAI